MEAGIGIVLCHTLGVSKRAFCAALWVAAAVGVALRVFHIQRGDSGVREFGDAEKYRLLAELMADGEGYLRVYEFFLNGRKVPTAEFPPLWPMLLAVLDLLGFDAANEQRALGALLGGMTVVVIGLLAAALVDRRVGVVAATLTAVYPQLIVIDTSLHAEGLAVLLVATALLGVVRARQAEDGVLTAAGRRWWILASVALGLGTLTRTEIILVAIALVVPACRVPNRRVWAQAAAVGLAGVVVSIGGWTVRNAISLGEVQPFTNNSGSLIAGANCDAVYSGSEIGLWDFDCVDSVETEAHLGESAVASEQRSIGFGHAVDNLSDLPAVGAVRVLRTFGAWDMRSQISFESTEGRDTGLLWAGWFGWLGLVAFSLGGVRLGDQLGWRNRWPLLVPLGVVFATALASYGNQRFRAIAEPGMLVLAATGLVLLVDQLRHQGAHEPA